MRAVRGQWLLGWDAAVTCEACRMSQSPSMMYESKCDLVIPGTVDASFLRPIHDKIVFKFSFLLAACLGVCGKGRLRLILVTWLSATMCRSSLHALVLLNGSKKHACVVCLVYVFLWGPLVLWRVPLHAY